MKLTQVYYEISQLKKIYDSLNTCQLVVWGTGEVAKEVTCTLQAFSIPIYAYGDNNKYEGYYFLERKILNEEEITKLPNPLIIIGSFVVRPIYEQLKAVGIHHIYAIIDTIKYDIDEWKKDSQAFEQKGSGKTYSQKVLVELYGNIGDVIIRLGLIAELIVNIGQENIWFLVEQEAIAEIIRGIAQNVIVLEKQAFVSDNAYRIAMLKKLNEHHFYKDIILCDIRLHANRRLLNQYNFDGGELLYHNIIPDKEYLPQMDAVFLKDIFKWDNICRWSPKHQIDDYIAAKGKKLELPLKFVAVNMGATKEIRHYAPFKFSDVLTYVLEKGIDVVMIGYGEYDETFYCGLPRNIKENEHVSNYIGKLSILESLAVIQKAAFFIGTDSGMWNASYILDCPSVVIYGGGEYGNFMHKDRKIHYVVSDEDKCFGCRWFCTNRASSGYANCIDSICPEMIIQKVCEVIEEEEI